MKPKSIDKKIPSIKLFRPTSCRSLSAMIVPKVRDITGPFDQRDDQKCEVTREHCLTISKVALKGFTMRGETSMAATTLVALFSTRPSAARQL